MSKLRQGLIASLSNTLNSSNVPCVLWGHCLLNVHGVPSIVNSIDFIVPDDQLPTSIEALSTCAKQLKACPHDDTCILGSDDRNTPPPAFHMHILDTPDVTVGLFVQSDTLWFLPSLRHLMPPAPGSLKATNLFIDASDKTVLPTWRPGRGAGAFDVSQQGHRVVVPRAVVLLEAFMRLYARDSGKKFGILAMAMIDYMILYVDEDGFLDATLLPDPLGSFYQQLKEEYCHVRPWTKELRAALDIPCDDRSSEH